MGIIVRNEEEKSQLAIEICDILSRAISCAKFHHSHKNKSPFINWYLVLRVEENADTDGIRKQYHKLALQLHPDKNKHSKAEAAFKLVSEAYYCLSDNARRAAFESQKKNTTSCTVCNTIPSNKNPPNHTNIKVYQEKSRSNRIQKHMKELKTKLKEEASIIERCLIANAMLSRRESSSANGAKKELPIFNPSDYKEKGYPHFRNVYHKKIDDLRAGLLRRNRYDTNSSPIFQYRSERSQFMSRCASTRNH